MEDSSINKGDNNSPSKTKMKFFGIGQMVDQMSHQAFSALVFVFFFSVVGLNSNYIGFCFIIFAVWDSINDPILGPISDRTKSRFGRRGFWILVSIVPFALINLFLYWAPQGSEISIVIYMIVVIMLYELFYTMFSMNQTVLFPEMFKTEKERSKANVYKNVWTIVGVIIGFVIPTVLISPLSPTPEHPAEEIAPMYLQTGILLTVLTIVFGFIFFKFCIQEDPQSSTKPDEMGSVLSQLKDVIKNKSFVTFVTANLFIWYVFKMLTTIILLYGQFVLEIPPGDIMHTLLLLVVLLTAALFFPVVEKLGNKYGMRNGLVITLVVWIIGLVPLGLMDGPSYQIPALLCMVLMGFGLSGALYYVDIIIAGVIDEDELKSGKRRQGSFYGINLLINRYSTILVFVSIMMVLNNYGWSDYLISPTGQQTVAFKTSLKILLSGFNIGAIIIAIILLMLFPLHGEKLKKVQEQLSEKRKKGI